MLLEKETTKIMNPIKAQRTWHSLTSKWITNQPWKNSSISSRKKRRKIKKGVLSNLIPVEVVNAITGEVAKGYMRDLSLRKLRKWLEYHNHRAQVEQVYLSKKNTLSHLKEEDLKDFPILIKLGKYQVPYLIDRSTPDLIIKGRQTVMFNLKTADNLKYLEIIAERKTKVMKVFNKIKRNK